MIANKNLYLNRDKTAVVAEDSPDAAFLLAGKGTEISPEAAAKYGLNNREEKAKTPAANKLAAPGENKSAAKKK